MQLVFWRLTDCVATIMWAWARVITEKITQAKLENLFFVVCSTGTQEPLAGDTFSEWFMHPWGGRGNSGVSEANGVERPTQERGRFGMNIEADSFRVSLT